MSFHGVAAGQRLADAVRGGGASTLTGEVAGDERASHNPVMIGRFFRDLRAALRLSVDQSAACLQTHADCIAALEKGDVRSLPPWPETVRVVMAYAAMAGVDGRPALALMSEQLSAPMDSHEKVERPSAPPGTSRVVVDSAQSPTPRSSWRIPRPALAARPDRAFYALSLPLGLLILGLNTSAVSASLTSVSDFFRTHFAEVRDGHRWIEVSDPRSRRGDKLRVGGG